VLAEAEMQMDRKRKGKRRVIFWLL